VNVSIHPRRVTWRPTRPGVFESAAGVVFMRPGDGKWVGWPHGSSDFEWGPFRSARDAQKAVERFMTEGSR